MLTELERLIAAGLVVEQQAPLLKAAGGHRNDDCADAVEHAIPFDIASKIDELSDPL